ncbi:TlpA family protein disulfide reductase [Methylobacterium nodulans]|uniref:Redoxin domain protein n=1 Tax=Methylobacterium nodulans (strain LMG 21967 / CNCM I-2342 / ORS 2060) TaxID=460265 RepID=B8IIK4_METNO|nr:TlpA disulfide reductase family protein [Methylobacterium nodulans]ACL59881.1 Redoxin domain protein [Methylobacterium nodulans ORS 2060]
MPLTERLIGDPAAEIRVQTYLKGTPIAALAQGCVHVVVFWETSCGPCTASIPRLTELQRRYPDVVFLGVAVNWTDFGELEAFVRDQGDAIGYRIAADLPLSPGERQGTMYRTWYKAAYETGVPSAFIIDRDGRIAWIGPPWDIDDPLAAVVEGRWDLAAAREEQEATLRRDKVRELWSLEETVERHLAAGDRTGLLQAYDTAFAADPGLEPLHGLHKFALLLLSARDEAALDYARHLIGAVVADQIDPLIQLGLMLAGAAEQGTEAPDWPPAATVRIGDLLIYLLSTMPAKAVEQGTEAPDWPPAAANLALTAITQAEALFNEETHPRLRMMLAEAAARALLVVGRTGEAADRARAARALAPAFALASDTELAAIISQLDQFVAHCDAAAGRGD